MGFAEDKVKEYIVKRYYKFHDVGLSRLLDYMPCLTLADRQEIRAYMDRKGEISSVPEFFDHLWGRSRWVRELISALEKNNPDLAKDIREVYEAAQLPSQRAPAARSPPAVARRPQSPGRVPVGPGARSSDSPPLSPTPSSLLQDYRSPVQETKSASVATGVAVEAEVHGNDVTQKIATPDQPHHNAVDSDSGLAVQRENRTDVQTECPRSLVRRWMLLREPLEDEEIQSATDADNLVPNRDCLQRHPTCVKNGYFGNTSQSVDSGLSPAPEVVASSALPASGNQPEENSYVFSDSSLLLPRGQVAVQAEEQTIQQPLLGNQQGDLLDNPAVNKPSLQMPSAEEQKGAQGQQEGPSKVNAVLLPQEEDDGHSQPVNSRRLDFRAMPSDANPTTILQRRGTTQPPSIPSETRTANCSEQDSSPVCSEEATPGNSQFSKGYTVDLETRGPFAPKTPRTAAALGQSAPESSPSPQRWLRKEPASPISNTVSGGRFQSPPWDLAGSSSTEVIPPSSPAAVSGTLSDGYHEVLKPPVQERELQGPDLWTTPEMMMGNVPLVVTVRPFFVTDNSANLRVHKNASRPSRDARVFHSNHEEEDISLAKPGVLVAEETAGAPLGQPSSNTVEPYSGTSDRLCFSADSSEESDPLMLSDSSRGSPSEDSGRDVSTATDGASLPSWDDNRLDGDSLRTHAGDIEELPSAKLAGAPEITGPPLGDASQPPGDVVDAAAEGHPVRDASPHPVCKDDRRNSCQGELISKTSSLPVSDPRLLAVGFALTSLAAVAFMFYKQPEE